jgi:hypothetical protein
MAAKLAVHDGEIIVAAFAGMREMLAPGLHSGECGYDEMWRRFETVTSRHFPLPLENPRR